MSGKTLYLSDLEGALLENKPRLSQQAADRVNRFIGGGGLFGCVTGRDFEAAAGLTAGLCLRLPLVLYDGALTVRPDTGEPLDICCVSPENLRPVVEGLRHFPGAVLVHALLEGRDRLSFLEGRETEGLLAELAERGRDERLRPVAEYERLWDGRPFRLSLAGEERAVVGVCPLLECGGYLSGMLRPDRLCPREVRLDVFRFDANREYAARKLRWWSGAEELVCFGAGPVDLPMFLVADRCYLAPGAPPGLPSDAGLLPAGEEAVTVWLERRAPLTDDPAKQPRSTLGGPS